MIKFRKARSARQTKNNLDAYLTLNGGELSRWLAREVQNWGEFSYAELENLIMTGGLNDLIDWQSHWAEVVNETFTPAWLAAISAAAIKATKGKIILDDSDIDVKNWLKTRGGELITVLSEESKKAVAMVILRGQAEKVLPKKIAQQIRPLIGLNERQAQANMTYRQRVYQNLLASGLPPVTAEARAAKAALRYAGKQHRERADMIVNTELAFAYNRGADIGIKRAIREGYMGRCEMVWTTAGTNRVCGRCLALKDKVVGHTDEDGVTLPPLHPRCRCAIIYREVAAPRGNKPPHKIPSSTATSTSLIPRTLEEAKNVAERLKPVVGKYFVRKSKWSGRVEISPRPTNCKLPNCAIGILLKDCPDEAILHELVHSYSTSYYPNEIYTENFVIEEASVQYLTQEIAKREGIELVGCDYDFWVEALKEINRQLALYDTDLEFARQLLRIPMEKRMDWLSEKIQKANSTFEQMIVVTEELGKLTWEALEKWIAEHYPS